MVYVFSSRLCTKFNYIYIYALLLFIFLHSMKTSGRSLHTERDENGEEKTFVMRIIIKWH